MSLTTRDFGHALLRSAKGEKELILLARGTAHTGMRSRAAEPALVSTSGLGVPVFQMQWGVGNMRHRKLD